MSCFPGQFAQTACSNIRITRNTYLWHEFVGKNGIFQFRIPTQPPPQLPPRFFVRFVFGEYWFQSITSHALNIFVIFITFGICCTTWII